MSDENQSELIEKRRQILQNMREGGLPEERIQDIFFSMAEGEGRNFFLEEYLRTCPTELKETAATKFGIPVPL